MTAIVNGNYGEMILPDTVKKIQKGVFEIVKIKRLVLPSSLQRIMNNNFENAINVSEIVISEGTEKIGKGAFIGAKGLKKVTVSGSVKVIGEKAFKDCTKLKEIELCEGIQTIEGDAFSGCKALLMVKLPVSVQEIGSRIFRDCAKLSSVEIHTPCLNQNIFDGCQHLEEVITDCEEYHIIDRIVYNQNVTKIIFITRLSAKGTNGVMKKVLSLK